MHIAFYISSHGYGHGVRSCAICNCFSKDVGLTVRTLLPEKYFIEELSRQFSYYPGQFDCGCVQSDSVTVDIRKTVQTYMKIADRNEKILEQEVAWCKQQGVDGILSDIASFPFEVAHKAAIPSIGISNFSWEDIYEPYVPVMPGFYPYFEKIKAQYRMADLLLALTPPNHMRSFKRRKLIGVVGRSGINKKNEIQSHYKMEKDKKIGLIYTGDFGMDTMVWKNLEKFKDWEFIGLYPLQGNPSNFRLIQKRNFLYQDVSASVDLIISKVGYGVYSECLINGIPLLYLPRTDFAEFPFLEKAIVDWGFGYCIPREDFYNLDWSKVLEKVKTAEKPEKADSFGAQRCASEIESFFNAG